MAPNVETLTPPGSPTPIGPYSHIAKVGDFITIGGVGGVNPQTGQLAGDDVYSQAVQILRSFEAMLKSVSSAEICSSCLNLSSILFFSPSQ